MTKETNFWRHREKHLMMGGALTLVVVLGVATLSARPMWQSYPANAALIRLSFNHSGVRNCRDRTADELAKLPPNMRAKELCDRRRAPVRVEMDIDGRHAFAANLSPSGFFGSGPSRVYRRFELPAGNYHVDLRLSDNPAVSGFAYSESYDIKLAPAQSAAIDFNAANGGFFLH